MAGLVWANSLEQPGRVYTNLMDMVDWLPTLYGAAGKLLVGFFFCSKFRKRYWLNI